MVNLLITVNNHTTKGYRTDNGEETRMNQDNTRLTKHKHVGVFLKWGYQKLDGLWWTVLVCPGWCKGVPLYMEHSTNIVMFLLTSFHRCSTNLRRYCQESMRWTSVKELCRDIHETSDGQLKDDEDNDYIFFVCVCQKVQVTWECDKPWFSWAYYFQTSPNRIISKYSRVLGKTWERKAMTNPPTRGIWEFSRIVGKLPADDWTASCTRFI